ncbi:flagellin N-terminal helical domain-containing protein [Sporosarcina aquimarina]|uniref:Flagellin n=1 Tax=Sporosarcina aquimarina TaxID=114975 RepID=A0ABU4G1H0_9BACL|nr:flagellin [Sporosarcina aquimarina]MDW0110814.1 flagellin [Sporosarcina aquimarina]
MIINHNIAAMNTHRQLGSNNAAASKNLEKLSSGMKINKAGDDAAGLAISEKMRGQIRGLDMAQKNAQDGISLIQTAEGALNETHDILQRMRELAVQSSNDTNTATDRGELQKEVDQLAQEITRIANNTEFNSQKLTDGSFLKTGTPLGTTDGVDLKFHIGANTGQNITVDIGAMDAASLGVSAAVDAENAKPTWVDNKVTVQAKTAKGIDISTQVKANTAIKAVNDAIETVSAERSKLGAVQNRLEHTINNLGTSSENLTQAESRIRDVDYVLSAA